MPELSEKTRQELLYGIPEEEKEPDHDCIDSDVPVDRDDNDVLGDLAFFPAEVRVLIYRQYFFDNGTSCHVRRSMRDIRSQLKEDAEDKITPRPCTTAHSLASNIDGISLLQTNKRICSEALPELYTQAQFHFDRLCPLQHFLSATPAASLSLVRSVRFEWVTYTFIYGSDYVADYVERIWEPVCARLMGLEGLRDLTVSVRPGWAGGWTVLGAARERCEDMLFGPVRKLEVGNVVLRCEAS
ncbi:fad-linked sulfhydryl oxidase alr [Diaporthe amygdali]|uniref:fad-linked sulfhydryl oxidase alr n=1 Tax=Phomopsis amygdali TaxID=1214568 RepID=UPI0022FF3BC9|nr:fad-linked sulfhydryl oxidase alr [Diaporthe amygdali]KAJ0120664.1 fad-linked sulfhydryl oxidase alr [Diaporthe amygdali]